MNSPSFELSGEYLPLMSLFESANVMQDESLGHGPGTVFPCIRPWYDILIDMCRQLFRRPGQHGVRLQHFFRHLALGVTHELLSLCLWEELYKGPFDASPLLPLKLIDQA